MSVAAVAPIVRHPPNEEEQFRMTSSIPSHPAPWPRVTPAAAGFDAALLDEAVRFAAAHETPWPRDLRAHLESGFFEPPPFNEILGPIRTRGAPNGLILRGGKLLASWGDTRQVDFTFSVAKSYLSLLAGLAVTDGLISQLDDTVASTVDDGGFDGPHNGAITWRHLLQQTSEWEGTLFGKSDVIDRNRNLAVEGKGRKGDARLLRPPGMFWEYNDVRVNRLALALLRRFRKPLPEVFAERIMQPIGASPETYQPTPQDVAQLSQARIIFENGAGLEAWLDRTLHDAAAKDALVVIGSAESFHKPHTVDRPDLTKHGY